MRRARDCERALKAGRGATVLGGFHFFSVPHVLQCRGIIPDNEYGVYQMTCILIGVSLWWNRLGTRTRDIIQVQTSRWIISLYHVYFLMNWINLFQNIFLYKLGPPLYITRENEYIQIDYAKLCSRSTPDETNYSYVIITEGIHTQPTLVTLHALSRLPSAVMLAYEAIP